MINHDLASTLYYVLYVSEVVNACDVSPQNFEAIAHLSIPNQGKKPHTGTFSISLLKLLAL